MEIKEIRRMMLKKWFEDRTIPPREKSYLSQLMSGTASFGERAARRIEADYGMDSLYLDGGTACGPVPVDLGSASSPSTPPGGPLIEQIDLMWVTSEDRRLLTLFHSTDEDGRAHIFRAAESVPRVVRPAIVSHKA